MLCRQVSHSKNYPNPFNPTTTIEFRIPVSSFVTIKVFDILGNEVRTLVHDNLDTGNHKIPFDATGLSGGVYFYRLTSSSFSETKRMVLLR